MGPLSGQTSGWCQKAGIYSRCDVWVLSSMGVGGIKQVRHCFATYLPFPFPFLFQAAPSFSPSSLALHKLKTIQTSIRQTCHRLPKSSLHHGCQNMFSHSKSTPQTNHHHGKRLPLASSHSCLSLPPARCQRARPEGICIF